MEDFVDELMEILTRDNDDDSFYESDSEQVHDWLDESSFC